MDSGKDYMKKYYQEHKEIMLENQRKRRAIQKEEKKKSHIYAMLRILNEGIFVFDKRTLIKKGIYKNDDGVWMSRGNAEAEADVFVDETDNVIVPEVQHDDV